VIRSRWYAHAARLFQTYDAVVLPSAQVWPFPVDWRWPQEINGRKMDTYHRWMEVVVPASLIGLPALSVPVGSRPVACRWACRSSANPATMPGSWRSARPGTGRRNGRSAARLWQPARFRARALPKGGIMRVLVIGSGSIGRRHHDNLQALGASSRLVSWRSRGDRWGPRRDDRSAGRRDRHRHRHPPAAD
jgi:hypothetical protein